MSTIRAERKNITKEMLRRIGQRSKVIQIVPPRHVVKPFYLHAEEQDLVDRPLASPTGPGGAQGFQNVAGSQIAVPKVTNIYLGAFWGDRGIVEGFSKAIVENGYLDPLNELGYGTGPGSYQGAIDGPVVAAGTVFHDADAQATVRSLLDQGTIQANVNSLFMLILPDGVAAVLDPGGAQSCAQFCGYHEAFDYNGTSVAYAVLPSSLCQPCGGLIGDFTAVYAHELAEAVTDKVPGQGWVSADGQENGDLEAWILFGWGPPEDPNRYTIQGYYTNERGNTAGAWR
ncbi:MAG TPA: hypothetical protein VN948_22745 [Terriglobales bacterium]|nr:hypothetical protein [Terriglobales bacterium]